MDLVVGQVYLVGDAQVRACFLGRYNEGKPIFALMQPGLSGAALEVVFEDLRVISVAPEIVHVPAPLYPSDPDNDDESTGELIVATLGGVAVGSAVFVWLAFIIWLVKTYLVAK